MVLSFLVRDKFHIMVFSNQNWQCLLMRNDSIVMHSGLQNFCFDEAFSEIAYSLQNRFNSGLFLHLWWCLCVFERVEASFLDGKSYKWNSNINCLSQVLQMAVICKKYMQLLHRPFLLRWFYLSYHACNYLW